MIFKKILNKILYLTLHIFLRLIKLTNHISNLILRLVTVLYHLDLLTDHFHRLLYILLDKVYHRGAEVSLQNIDVLEIECETFHIVNTLYSEDSSREERTI